MGLRYLHNRIQLFLRIKKNTKKLALFLTKLTDLKQDQENFQFLIKNNENRFIIEKNNAFFFKVKYQKKKYSKT